MLLFSESKFNVKGSHYLIDFIKNLNENLLTFIISIKYIKYKKINFFKTD